MSREVDETRKPALLADILDYLLDKPLATLSFRTLADGLGVSTFTLVYHFGSRSELLGEIVRAISAREREVFKRLTDGDATLEAYFDGLERSWEWSVQPRNRKLQRLQFEASILEALDPTSHTFTRELFTHWQAIGEEALRAIGLSEADAALEARLTIDTIFGIQYDLLVNGDVDRATAAYRHLVASHRARIEGHLEDLGHAAAQ